MGLIGGVIIFFVIILLANAIRILQEYERGVIFRLGRLVGARGPGLILIIPFIDRVVKVSLRVITLDVPSQDVITRDNVSVGVNAVVYFRVMDPSKAIVAVQDYLYATSQIAQTTLRSVLGQESLDALLSERDKINVQLQKIIDEATDPWGIKVTNVEVKMVELPDTMKRVMSKQAEAEREKRAKIIHAEGELASSAKLAQAAGVINKEEGALQLRFLQTLTDVAAEKNSTTLFPIPIDLFTPFIKKMMKE